MASAQTLANRTVSNPGFLLGGRTSASAEGSIGPEGQQSVGQAAQFCLVPFRRRPNAVSAFANCGRAVASEPPPVP